MIGIGSNTESLGALVALLYINDLPKALNQLFLPTQVLLLLLLLYY